MGQELFMFSYGTAAIIVGCILGMALVASPKKPVPNKAIVFTAAACAGAVIQAILLHRWQHSSSSFFINHDLTRGGEYLYYAWFAHLTLIVATFVVSLLVTYIGAYMSMISSYSKQSDAHRRPNTFL